MRVLTFVLIAGASTASAQTVEFNFNAGVGASSSPLYLGSSDVATGVTGSFEFGDFTYNGRCFGCDDSSGFGLTGSFSFIGAREGEQDILPDSPLNDIDAAIEIGGGLSYTSASVEAFAVVRRGFGGHEGYVAELGGDYILAVSDAVTLRAGPRLLAGDETFVDTYFGTSAGFSGNAPYEPLPGGIVSRGVEISASYDFDDTWGVTGTARYDQLLNEAAASGISQSDDQTTLSLVVTRNFSWSF